MSDMPKYTLELDAATIDALYTAIAEGEHDGVRRRLGAGAQHRAFSKMHAQLPQPMPSPREIRGWLLADERRREPSS